MYVPLGYTPQLVGWGGKTVICGSEYDRRACCLVEFDYQLK